MLSADISNIWGTLSLSDLLESEQAVFAAHGLIADGVGPGGGYLGWRKLQQWTQDISALAEQVREHSAALVVVGVDGCAQAAQGAAELLLGGRHNMLPGRPQIYYAGEDLSSRRLRELLEILDNTDFSINLISKSGDEPELHLAARSLRWLLERKYGSTKAAQHIVVTTDPTAGALRQMARGEGWRSLEIPRDVPTCCGMLSPAVLFPLAVAGVEPEAVLAGARDCFDAMDVRSFENPVWLYAVARYLLWKSGERGELLLSNEPDAAAFGRWWRQLMAASGAGLFPTTAADCTDLRALRHQDAQARPAMVETFLRFAPEETPLPVESDWKNLDGLGALEGKPLPDVQAAVMQTMLERHVDAGIPALTLDCDPLSPATVGELGYFFQLSATLTAYLMGLDPYAERSLAEYHQNTMAVLSGL